MPISCIRPELSPSPDQGRVLWHGHCHRDRLRSSDTQCPTAQCLDAVAHRFDAGQEGTAVISGLTQEQIGELANAARDVVNRTLKQFASNGWIDVAYKKIRLLEPAELEAFCS
ncbi:helix-turn-helix domain-containing protein [uncultured Ruegeria sp.]|uniref:helix-turn-helix domain-containing protein n=1 Tax=uncultured Ruegeria sp. TaxID=259304 RepID=UPI003456704C